MTTRMYTVNGKPATAEEFAPWATEALKQLQEDNKLLQAAVDRVRRMHSQDDSMMEPGKWCPGCGDTAPCKTERALRGIKDAR